MGKIKQGILGGFKGKVGTVIGSSWNGISYMRGIAQSVKNANTAAQQTQRAFFIFKQYRRRLSGIFDVTVVYKSHHLSGFNPQILSAYSRTERSDEKKPEAAILSRLICAQSFLSA